MEVFIEMEILKTIFQFFLITSLYLQSKMTKQDHIDYWKRMANRDWIAVQNMFKSKDYMHALFFSHLVLEKLLKAHWVKDHLENHPPKIHNLVVLHSKTEIILKEDDLNFLRRMNDFSLSGRYQDYLDDFYNRYKSKETKEILNRVNKIRLCLQKELL